MAPTTVPTAKDVKVTSQGVHAFTQEMGWDVETRRSKYPTKYKYNPKTKEQFKLIVREYSRMEEEKDKRQFGSLLDSLARMKAGDRVEPRWGEVMKVVSPFLEIGEYGAMAAAAAMYDAVDSPEQRNGLLAQTNDEVRHVTQCGYLSQYFASQYYDPAGWTDIRKTRFGGALLQPDKNTIVDQFVSGDPVQMSLNLQLVAEAAFTNPLIVALTEYAAANGDEITPTIFLSIESDELRHMANGYQTIVSVVDDADNMKYLQTDVENAFWIQHKFLTPFIGAVFEYGSVHRGDSWARIWERWIYEDWGGVWLGRLGKFGLESPKNLPDAKKDTIWGHHYAFAAAFALWPLNGIRLELPNKQDYEWFEKEYPGYFDEIGNVLDAWQEEGVEDPANHRLPVENFIESTIPLYFCRVCQMPTLLPTLYDGLTNLRLIEWGGRKHALCSEWCERMYLKEPERYNGQNWFEQFDGWDIADIARASGALRSDGKTLQAQPHLRSEKMWTIDDLAACKITIHDPLGTEGPYDGAFASKN
jgi:methane monooxygenase component A alpha chain